MEHKQDNKNKEKIEISVCGSNDQTQSISWITMETKRFMRTQNPVSAILKFNVKTDYPGLKLIVLKDACKLFTEGIEVENGDPVLFRCSPFDSTYMITQCGHHDAIKVDYVDEVCAKLNQTYVNAEVFAVLTFIHISGEAAATSKYVHICK